MPFYKLHFDHTLGDDMRIYSRDNPVASSSSIFRSISLFMCYFSSLGRSMIGPIAGLMRLRKLSYELDLLDFICCLFLADKLP